MTSNIRFSAVQRHSSPSSCAFSPGSSLYAAAFDDHIIVRFTEDMQPATHFVCSLGQQGIPEGIENTQIKHLTWRFDSKYLLACDPQFGVVWVFAVTDASREPRAVIRAGVEGFARCEWSGTGTEVLCFSDNGVSTVIQCETGFHFADKFQREVTHNDLQPYRWRDHIHSRVQECYWL